MTDIDNIQNNNDASNQLRIFIESVAGAMNANIADTLGFGSKADGDAGGVRPDGE